MAKINISFWNINDVYNPERFGCLESISKESDIIILAEAYSDYFDNKLPDFKLISPIQISGRVWTKFFKNKNSNFSLTREGTMFNNRIVISKLIIPGNKDIYILGVHLRSKVGIDEITHFQDNIEAAREIHEFIEKKHNRVIIVGDLNHNPFDSFMVSRGALNSFSSRNVVSNINKRTYKKKERTMFYNPMWNFLGDYDFNKGKEKINGTYYFKESSIKFANHIHWNLLDQVLISQSIMNYINPKSIKIIDAYRDKAGNLVNIAESTLTSKKTFINDTYSDHLPLQFELETINIQ